MSPRLPLRTRGEHIRISLALVAVLTARVALAQTVPPTPVWEASGYGAVHGYHDSGWLLYELAVRPADAGGPAEFTMFPENGAQLRAERWQVSALGVPFLKGYVPMQGQPQNALWTDIDGDGASDLVCLEKRAGGWIAEVLLMRDGAPRTPGRTLALPQLGAVDAMLETDVNGDGLKDVAVVATYGSIWLLRTASDSLVVGPEIMQWDMSTATDSVRFGPFLPDPFSTDRFVLGPLDPDAIPELVRWDAPSFAMQFGRVLSGGDIWIPSTTFPGSGSPLFADFDADGLMDLVSGRYLYRGDPSGTPVLLDSLSKNVVAIADVDRDGRLDLVAIEPGSVSVARGRGGFRFDPFVETPAGAIAPQHLQEGNGRDSPAFTTGLSAVADLNGDGWVDVVSAGPAAGELDVIPGHVGGGFFSPLRLPTAADPVQVDLVDVVGADGRLDIVTLDRGARELEVRAGGGDGSFGPPHAFALPAGPVRFALGDMDGDGWLDAVVACDSSHTLSILRGGPSGFGSRLDLTASDPLTDVQLADVDEDGKLDICASTAAGDLAGWRGLGGMNFTPAAWTSNSRGDGRLLLADFDGDGHQDLVTLEPGACWGCKSFVLERGNGRGDFTLQYVSPPFGSIRAPRSGARSPFTVADLVGDGGRSLVIAGTDSTQEHTVFSELVAYTPDGSGYPRGLPDLPNDGYFGYALPPGPSQVSVADVTGDGILDVIVLSEFYHSLTVLPGLDGLHFGTPISHVVGGTPSSYSIGDGVGTGPTSFALGDVDGDGLPDAVVADAGSSDVMVLRHRGTQLTGVTPVVAVASRLSLRVASAPSSARVRLQLSLVGSAPATLDAYDVAGRRLGRQRIDGGAGTHVVELESRLTPRSGLVFLRLAQGGESATTRAVRVR